MTRIALVALTALTVLTGLTACVVDEVDLEEVESEASTSGPTITELERSEEVTISGGPNTIKYFKIVVPAAHDHVRTRRDGPLSVGADVYMKRGGLPSLSSYDCRQLNGNSEPCTIDYAAGGTYYIMVRGAGPNGYSNMTLHATYGNKYVPLQNNASISIWNQYGVDSFHKLVVPSGTASVSFTFTLDPDDDGAVDLVVNYGGFATATAYDCKREIDWYQWTETGTCTFTNPPAGTYYAALLGNDLKVVGTFRGGYRWPAPTAPTTQAN